jgi:hypothetical protein
MMELLETIAKNWAEIMAGLIVMVASGGKVAEMLIKTVSNIKDAWQDAFKKNPWR